ncbi:MAG TPA: hypothetical protein VN704_05340 [Verrucomicrobiae bacterium]|nr:hypothetical protein [Verrucomicrobiae bacterium]
MRSLVERIGMIKEQIDIQLQYSAVSRKIRVKIVESLGSVVAIRSRNAKSMPEKEVNTEVSRY